MPTSYLGLPETYLCSVMARKTRSSIAIVRMKLVGTAVLAIPTDFPALETTGPAGLPVSEPASPGSSEMRVVFGVHAVVAPKQVSRTKTCRYPLLSVPALAGYFDDVTERNATKRPEELTEGSRLSLPASAPDSSIDSNVVCGMQAGAAPVQVSRR